jgi:hypothetical protein
MRGVIACEPWIENQFAAVSEIEPQRVAARARLYEPQRCDRPSKPEKNFVRPAGKLLLRLIEPRSLTGISMRLP